MIDFLKLSNLNADEDKIDESFQKLPLESRNEILNLFSLIDMNRLAKLTATDTALYQKLMKSKNETAELRNIFNKAQQKPLVCSRNDNLYGFFKLFKETTLAFVGLLNAGQGLNNIVCLILVLIRFNSEILQSEYGQIRDLNIFEVIVVLSAITLTNFIITMVLNFKAQQSYYGRARYLTIFPFFHDAMIFLEKVCLLTRKFKTHKDLDRENKKKEIEFEKLLQLSRKSSYLQRLIEHGDNEASTTNSLTSLVRNFSLSICTFLILLRPNLVSLLVKSVVTKRIPELLLVILFLDLIFLCLNLRRYKIGIKQDLLSVASLVYMTALLSALYPKFILLSLLSAEHLSLMFISRLLMTVLTFVLNQVFNEVFQRQSFGEKLCFAVISSTVPTVTIRDPPMNGETELAGCPERPNYRRKKTVSQLISNILLNILELCLLTVGIIVQSELDKEYKVNISELIANYSWDLKKIFGSCFLSYIISCLLTWLYYARLHPEASTQEDYNWREELSLLPRVHFQYKDIENKLSNKQDDDQKVNEGNNDKEIEQKTEKEEITSNGSDDDDKEGQDKGNEDKPDVRSKKQEMRELIRRRKIREQKEIRVEVANVEVRIWGYHK